QEKKDEREHARRASGKLQWVGANLLEVQIPEEQRNRDQRVYEDNGLSESNGVCSQMTSLKPQILVSIPHPKSQTHMANDIPHQTRFAASLHCSQIVKNT